MRHEPIVQDNAVNWDRIEANWERFKGSAKQCWGKLTDNQLAAIAGRRDQLVGRIQDAYGITKEATERQISVWQANLKEDQR